MMRGSIKDDLKSVLEFLKEIWLKSRKSNPDGMMTFPQFLIHLLNVADMESQVYEGSVDDARFDIFSALMDEVTEGVDI